MGKRTSHSGLTMVAVIASIIALSFLAVVFFVDFLTIVKVVNGRGSLISALYLVAIICLLITLFISLFIILEGANNGLRYTIFILFLIVALICLAIFVAKQVIK